MPASDWQKNPTRVAFETVKDVNKISEKLNKRSASSPQPAEFSKHSLIRRLIPCLENIGQWTTFLAKTISLPEGSEDATLIWGIISVGIDVRFISWSDCRHQNF